MSANLISFHDLYERHSSEVFRFAYGLCKDVQDAEDIASETFVRVWTSAGEIRAETVKAYLFTIARNIFLHDRRRASRRTTVEEHIADTGPGPDRLAEVGFALEKVMKSIQKMPAIDRSVLMMRAQEGLSYEEIALATGLSVPAIKVKIFRARLRLKSEASSQEE